MKVLKGNILKQQHGRVTAGKEEGRRGEEEFYLPFAVSVSKGSARPKLGALSGSPQGCQGPRDLSHHLLLPRVYISRKLVHKPKYALIRGVGHLKKQFNPLTTPQHPPRCFFFYPSFANDLHMTLDNYLRSHFAI